jgi:hypothetical protein
MAALGQMLNRLILNKQSERGTSAMGQLRAAIWGHFGFVCVIPATIGARP